MGEGGQPKLSQAGGCGPCIQGGRQLENANKHQIQSVAAHDDQALLNLLALYLIASRRSSIDLSTCPRRRLPPQRCHRP